MSPVQATKSTESHRIYTCHRCRVLVRICQRCDRGNRYCSSTCSQEARKECCRRASRRYQATDRGRRNANARQQRYLMRKFSKMTHHGSAIAPTRAHTPDETASSPSQKEKNHGKHPVGGPEMYQCSFCGSPLGPYARRHFKHQSPYASRARRSPQ